MVQIIFPHQWGIDTSTQHALLFYILKSKILLGKGQVRYLWIMTAGLKGINANRRQACVNLSLFVLYWHIQYIPRNMHTVFALLCFVVVIHWLIFPYPSGLLHWHCGNLTIAPVPAKQPWWIWINTSCEFIMNDCITTTKQSTTKPCAYFLGYTVYRSINWISIVSSNSLVPLRCQAISWNNADVLPIRSLWLDFNVNWNEWQNKIVHEMHLQSSFATVYGIMRSIPWLIMPGLHISPGNQQQRCCLHVCRNMPSVIKEFTTIFPSLGSRNDSKVQIWIQWNLMNIESTAQGMRDTHNIVRGSAVITYVFIT